jgi:copper chaperone CopZ
MKRSIFAFALILFAAIAFGENAVLSMKVTGMTCGGCEAKFKSVATKVNGIAEVKEVSAEKGSATIAYDPALITAEKAIQTLAENTGYTITATTSIGQVQVEGKPAGCCIKGQKNPACNKNKE